MAALDLIKEYVEATALELGWTEEEIIPYVDEYDNFPGPYREKGDFLLVEFQGRLAGCVGITPGADGLCEMNRLWVRSDYRRHGLGRVLVEASLRRAAELGYQRMGLDVLASRLKALHLYQSLGFEQCRPFHEYEFEVIGLERKLDRLG